MTESNNSMLVWIALVAGLVFGCVALAGLGLAGGLFYATERTAPEIAPLPPALPAEPPVEVPHVLRPCPPAHPETNERRVRLTPTAFWIEATDEPRIELPYQGSAYPYPELRANLIERRRMAPNEEAMNITAERGVPSSVPARALGIAREIGYGDAIVCIERTPPVQVEQGGGSGTALSGPRADERDRIASVRPRTERLRTGNPDVRGSLPRDVVRRVVRRHIGEIRHCYESGLLLHPDLEGRVTASFVISPTGTVLSATVGSSTLNSASVESCITGAVRRWTFPAPQGGGVVAVNYPFVLSTR